MTVQPQISVLTSCYNASAYLSEAIESILSQSYKDFEFIMIDDGSMDDTLDVIKRYALKDHRIVIIEKINTGLADSLNHGIKMARGEWIARLDADDIALPFRLEKQINYVRSFPDIVLAGSGCIVIDQQGRESKTYKYPSGSGRVIKQLIKGRSPFPHSTAFYSAEAARRLGGYRPRIFRAEDKDLWLRLSRVGEIGCLPEPLIKLRKHAESITAKDKKCAITSYAAMVSFLLEQAGWPDPVEQSDVVYQSFLAWIEKRMIEDGYFERNKRLAVLREEWQHSRPDSIFMRMLLFSKGLLYSPHGIKIIREKIQGSNLSIRLMKEWVETCVS